MSASATDSAPGCRVLVVDDNPGVRKAIEPALARWGCAIVGMLGSADGLVEVVVRERPDVLLLDLDMPGRSPFHVIEDLRLRGHPTKIVVYSALGDERTVRDCLAGGVHAYVFKADPPDALRASLCAVLAGQTYLSPGVAPLVAKSQRDAGAEYSVEPPSEPTACPPQAP